MKLRTAAFAAVVSCVGLGSALGPPGGPAPWAFVRAAWAEDAAPPRAPAFRLESTAGDVRSLATYAGRVLLLMYEDKDSEAVNAALKREVQERMVREALGARLVVVPVADVRGYDYWPAKGIVRGAVRGRAEELRVVILLDWEGTFAQSYGFGKGSHIALVGADGGLLYKRSGAVGAAERERFHAALTAALSKNAVRQPAAD